MSRGLGDVYKRQEIEYPISIDFLLNGDYKIFISKGNNYLVGYFDVLK